MAILNNILSTLPNVGDVHNAKNLVDMGTPTQDILTGLLMSGNTLLMESAAMILDINDRYNPKSLLDNICETSAYKADAAMALEVNSLYEQISPVGGLNYRSWLNVYNTLSKYNMYESVAVELDIATVDVPNDIFNIQLLEAINDMSGQDELLMETLVGCIGRSQKDAAKFIMNETFGQYNDRLSVYDVISESLERYDEDSLPLPNSALIKKTYYPSSGGSFPVGTSLYERVGGELVRVDITNGIDREFAMICESWLGMIGKSDLNAFVVSKGITYNMNEGVISYGGESTPLTTGDAALELVAAGVDRNLAANASITIKHGSKYYNEGSYYESVDIPGGIVANLLENTNGNHDIILHQLGTGATEHVARDVKGYDWIFENYGIDVSGGDSVKSAGYVDEVKAKVKNRRIEMVNEAIEKVKAAGEDINEDILSGLYEHVENIEGVDKSASADAAVALSESLTVAVANPKTEVKVESDLYEAYVVNVAGINHIRFTNLKESVAGEHNIGNTKHGYDIINEDNIHTFANIIGKHVYESNNTTTDIEQFMIDRKGEYRSLLENHNENLLSSLALMI